MSPPDTLIRLLPPCLHWHPDGEIRLVGQRIGLYHFIMKSIVTWRTIRWSWITSGASACTRRASPS